MKKTSNFFIIDNYNTVPKKLLEYCENYLIYDASDKIEISNEINRLGLKSIKVPRTGHNITTYFDFFIKNYENLPEVMNLIKGNIIGRHCSEEFFERVYDNKYFTYLYEDKEATKKMVHEIAFMTMENQFLEINNSWYVNSPEHPHDYFTNFNDLLLFIFKSPVIPRYCTFAPGTCYIIRREQVLKYSKEFYINLYKIMSYGLRPNFPSEAHQIERMFPIIFMSNYEVNDWMNNLEEFDSLINNRKLEIIKSNNDRKNTIKFKLKRIFKRG
ncbi:MAG: DUF3431 domain-containing protein [Fusobacteriaceae bacterium]|nr:DUF3431 domain-containing protein [Fusobacteriaceae bacterium]